MNPESKSSNPKLPFVLVNMSMTADGKIASSNRVVSSFSSQRDQEHLLELRATADAVMCGARTVDLNKVNLGPGGTRFRRLRLKRGLNEQNLRIIVSGSGTLDPAAHIFTQRARRNLRQPSKHQAQGPIIILTTARAGRKRLSQLREVADEVRVFGRSKLDLRAALVWLRVNWNVRRLVCEGGGELNDAMFRADLVDELHLTLCPRILGGKFAPTIAEGDGASRLTQASNLTLKSATAVKSELFLVFARKGNTRKAR